MVTLKCRPSVQQQRQPHRHHQLNEMIEAELKSLVSLQHARQQLASSPSPTDKLSMAGIGEGGGKGCWGLVTLVAFINHNMLQISLEAAARFACTNCAYAALTSPSLKSSPVQSGAYNNAISLIYLCSCCVVAWLRFDLQLPSTFCPAAHSPCLCCCCCLLLTAVAAAEWNVQRHYFYDCSGIQNLCVLALSLLLYELRFDLCLNIHPHRQRLYNIFFSQSKLSM